MENKLPKNPKSILAKITRKRNLKDALFIAVGVIMASIGLRAFLLPNNFLDGGSMGVSLLLQILTEVDLSILIVLVNLPFIFLGAKQFSVNFAIKSAIAICTLAVLVHVIHLPIVTTDKLLIAVFGGFFLGCGIGFSIRGGAVIDGSEVLAISISRKSSLSVGDAISVFNVLLFCIAAILVNIETAMYSMLTYLAASKTVDFIINGVEEYLGVMIVSNKDEAIKAKITAELGRGVTAFKSEGGYTPNGQKPEERKVLYCVITRLEITKLLTEIEKVDPSAFIIQQPLRDTKGGMIKKRPLH